jgi:hypothetical protein
MPHLWALGRRRGFGRSRHNVAEDTKGILARMQG